MSAKQNITLSLDQDLIRRARVLAAQRNSSVSKLLASELGRLLQEADRYERAKQAALADLAKGFHLGGQPLSREEIHDR